MKLKKLSFIAVPVLALSVFLAGCEINFMQKGLGDLNEALNGRTVQIQTYDTDSNIIDKISGKSVSFSADDKFALKDSDGNTTEKSSVINMTVGGKEALHVGSSMIAYEDGLTNIFDEYAKSVDISNNDRSVPVINRIVNKMKNLTTGKDTIILIRSQTGKPLATFAGNDVSYYVSDIDKATEFLIDGKLMLVYRCDFSVYEKDLLK